MNKSDDIPRQRSTWRLSNNNYDFVCSEAERLGISMNGSLNVLLAELRATRKQLTAAVIQSRKDAGK